jgi:hypothetical protein
VPPAPDGQASPCPGTAAGSGLRVAVRLTPSTWRQSIGARLRRCSPDRSGRLASAAARAHPRDPFASRRTDPLDNHVVTSAAGCGAVGSCHRSPRRPAPLGGSRRPFELRLGQRGEPLLQAPLAVRLGERGHQHRRGDELHRVVGQIASPPSEMARCVLPTPGGPSSSRFSPFAIQRPAAKSRTCLGSTEGRASKSKLWGVREQPPHSRAEERMAPPHANLCEPQSGPVDEWLIVAVSSTSALRFGSAVLRLAVKIIHCCSVACYSFVFSERE